MSEINHYLLKYNIIRFLSHFISSYSTISSHFYQSVLSVKLLLSVKIFWLSYSLYLRFHTSIASTHWAEQEVIDLAASREWLILLLTSIIGLTSRQSKASLSYTSKFQMTVIHSMSSVTVFIMKNLTSVKQKREKEKMVDIYFENLDWY